jgi:chondroitin AC lyase
MDGAWVYRRPIRLAAGRTRGHCGMAILLACGLCYGARAHSQPAGPADTIIARYKRFIYRSSHSYEISGIIASYDKVRQWPDIGYDDTLRAGWRPMGHLGRIGSMAFAWADPASGYYHRASLLAIMNSALDYWLHKRFHSLNWWNNEIGVPMIMRDILVLLRDSLGTSRLKGALEIMDQYRLQKSGAAANLVWSADLGLHYGALTGNDTLIRHCADLLKNEIRVTTGDGIQPDYSFHQHDGRLYMYQYGAAFLENNTRLAWELQGTPWAYGEEKIKILTDFVLNGWQWMARGINTVPGTVDRSVSRLNALRSPDIREWIPYLCKLYPRRAEALAAIGAFQDGQGKGPEGFRYFPYSDLAVYQDRHFSFFLKTLSDRSLPTESINGENLKGRLLNSGDGYTIKNGNEYFNLMPVWDWNKLPGVTGFQGDTGMVRRPFCGSVSDGRSGVTVMDYEMADAAGHSLTARKYWAAHGDLVICLVAGLRQHNGYQPAFTALDQCRWQGDVTVGHWQDDGAIGSWQDSVAAGRPAKGLPQGDYTPDSVGWIHHAGLAYIFLGPATVHLHIGQDSGSWRAINVSESPAMVTDKVFLPVMLHPSDLRPLSTGYVLAYAGTAAETQALARKPSWEVLQNDSNCQAVRFDDGTILCAFYTKGGLDPVKGDVARSLDPMFRVDRPCLILYADGHLYASDPSHRGGAATVGMNDKIWHIQLPKDGTTVAVPIFGP